MRPLPMTEACEDREERELSEIQERAYRYSLIHYAEDSEEMEWRDVLERMYQKTVFDNLIGV